MSDILKIENLEKTLGKFKLDGVSFSLPRGFIMGFIGPNGAGKTTTIKLILNMLERDGGDIRIFGEDNRKSEREIKEKIGIVMDKTFLADEWRLCDAEKVLSKFYKFWNAEKFFAYLDRFGLDRTKRVKELSRGMKMKLAIASALSHDAELLLLDEPTSGLDAPARNELLDILSEFIGDESKSVLFSTHITSDLEKTADFITFIREGKIVFTGAKDELLGKYALVKGGRQISPDFKKKIIGYRGHSVGFDGLVEKSALSLLPDGIVAESADLDEIIVRFGAGEN